MQLAEKRDAVTDEEQSPGRAAKAGGAAAKSPAASLTAELVRRTQEDLHAIQDPPGDGPAVPDPVEPPTGTQILPVSDAAIEPPEQPVGARAQQAMLADAFADPDEEFAPPSEAIPVAMPIERSEFESTRHAAENWKARSGPPASFWERLAKDVAIFTIVFAALTFAILQTM